MGHHFVPQAHLRRFEIVGKPKRIWRYDKIEKRWSEAAIKKVAQEPDFYDQEIEVALNEDVEFPSNAAFGVLNR